MFSQGSGQPLHVDTRPRFLGGQYQNKINEKIESKYQIAFSKDRDRDGIENDVKNLFAGKHDLRQTERKLKELEKEFTKKLEQDYLAQVREGKMTSAISERVVPAQSESKPSLKLPLISSPASKWNAVQMWRNVTTTEEISGKYPSVMSCVFVTWPIPFSNVNEIRSNTMQ